MEAQEEFLLTASLICEPARARIMWNLLDGKAYTATELAMNTGISSTAASNHLSKLLSAGLLKLEKQGRHRYYAFSRPDVAYAVESLAALSADSATKAPRQVKEKTGIQYCRTCYDHLAGYAGVTLVNALEGKNLLVKADTGYTITHKGWKWFDALGIDKEQFSASRRPIARQCIDWTERKPHLAGQLGAALLQKMMERKWFKKVRLSRALLVTPKGSRDIYDLLGMVLH